jgi:hypothetical protein
VTVQQFSLSEITRTSPSSRHSRKAHFCEGTPFYLAKGRSTPSKTDAARNKAAEHCPYTNLTPAQESVLQVELNHKKRNIDSIAEYSEHIKCTPSVIDASRIRKAYGLRILTLCFRDKDASLCVNDSRDELPLERPNLVQLCCIEGSGQKAACGKSEKKVDGRDGRSQ